MLSRDIRNGCNFKIGSDASGFRGIVLNCPCPREGGSCRRKSVLLVGGWVGGWVGGCYSHN